MSTEFFFYSGFYQEVLKATQVQLERELSLEDVSCVQDLPGYNLLIQ
jgi:hypothetical protein